jgi:hypothetical protein
MITVIAVLPSPGGLIAVFSNDTYAPVVNLFDGDGELTDNLKDAVSAVAGPIPHPRKRKGEAWIAFEVPAGVTIQ